MKILLLTIGLIVVSGFAQANQTFTSEQTKVLEVELQAAYERSDCNTVARIDSALNRHYVITDQTVPLRVSHPLDVGNCPMAFSEI